MRLTVFQAHFCPLRPVGPVCPVEVIAKVFHAANLAQEATLQAAIFRSCDPGLRSSQART